MGTLADSLIKMIQNLREPIVSRHYVDNIFRTMGDTLIVLGLDGKIRTVNRATCDVLGYEEEETHWESRQPNRTRSTKVRCREWVSEASCRRTTAEL